MDTDTHLSFEMPPGWQIRSHRAAGVIARARPPRRARAGVPPEIVLRTTTVADDLEPWRRQALAALEHQLPGFELEDDEEYDLGGRPACYHRFGHRLGTADLVSEQWSWLAGGLGVTLTCTVAREEYAAYCELFEDVAATVEILGAAA